MCHKILKILMADSLQKSFTKFMFIFGVENWWENFFVFSQLKQFFTLQSTLYFSRSLFFCICFHLVNVTSFSSSISSFLTWNSFRFGQMLTYRNLQLMLVYSSALLLVGGIVWSCAIPFKEILNAFWSYLSSYFLDCG